MKSWSSQAHSNLRVNKPGGVSIAKRRTIYLLSEKLPVLNFILTYQLTMNTKIHSITALDAAPRATPSSYPEPFRSMMNGRVKRSLGDLFGLTKLGVNITVLAPGAMSALRHAHSKQDEFVYVVSGTLALYCDDGRTELHAGMCAGFKAAR